VSRKSVEDSPTLNIFRVYGLPLLAGLPVIIGLGLLGAFLIPQVNNQALRMFLFLFMCFLSVVASAFVLHHMPDHTLDFENEDEAEDAGDAKKK
jgi:hypothetical protein